MKVCLQELYSRLPYYQGSTVLYPKGFSKSLKSILLRKIS